MGQIFHGTFAGKGEAIVATGTFGLGPGPRMALYEKEAVRQRRLPPPDPETKEFVRMATLAPNGHNTQPWKFRVDAERIEILPDMTRRTRIVDPDDHHLYVSLGCAAENLVLAAAAGGRAAEVTIETAEETRIGIDLPRATPVRSALYDAIPLRQSTRSLYDGQPVSSGDMALLEAAAREDGVSVLFFTDLADREAILDYVVEGNSAQMDDPAFVRELRDWLRFSPARAMKTGDGLFSACSGNPVMPDWIGGRVFPAVFRTATENEKYRAQARSSAGFAVFAGDRDDAEHWMRTGRSFERFALQATVLGIRTAHMNQPAEVPAVRTDFARWLGLSGARPDLVIRFGRAPAMPMSLRRPVDEVLV